MNALVTARIACAQMWAKRDLLIDQVLDRKVSSIEAQPWIDEMAKAANILDGLAGYIYYLRNRPVEEETEAEHRLEVNAVRYSGAW